ncbi:MAG TPA: glycosyltransferase, partial [Candidatus Eisenbacteria bacterium]|nr:glycosyltransferase [Candidatus Eisenbacteria bacterium]
MTTKEEQSHFEWHARTVYSGVGEIADLGCWLGSTTISLARGLSRNPLAAASEKKVHAFDRFLWEDWMDAFVSETPLGRNYRPGESFLDEFQHRTRPWAERITVYMGDLCQLPWIGHEIEILLIDAMKSWDLANAIVSKFFPYLIPQQSYIFHQDFAHCHTPWIHLIQYRFRRFFEPLHLVSRSTTFVFKHAASIPSAMLGIEFSPKCFSKEEIDDAFEYSLSLISDRSAQARVAAAKILLWVQLGETVHADRELDRFLRLGFPIVSDMKVVMQKLGRAPEPPRGGGGKSLKAIKTLAKLAR